MSHGTPAERAKRELLGNNEIKFDRRSGPTQNWHAWSDSFLASCVRRAGNNGLAPCAVLPYIDRILGL